MAGQQSALSLDGSKVLVCSFPCLDFVIATNVTEQKIFEFEMRVTDFQWVNCIRGHSFLETSRTGLGDLK